MAWEATQITTKNDEIEIEMNCRTRDQRLFSTVREKTDQERELQRDENQSESSIVMTIGFLGLPSFSRFTPFSNLTPPSALTFFAGNGSSSSLNSR